MAGREEAIARDLGVCRGCGRQYTQVHHIVFRSQGGSDEAENLVCLCDTCHRRAHGLVVGKLLSKTMLKAIIQTRYSVIDLLYMKYAICYTCMWAGRNPLGQMICKQDGEEVSPIHSCGEYFRAKQVAEGW